MYVKAMLIPIKEQEGKNVDLKRSVRTLETVLGQFERRL